MSITLPAAQTASMAQPTSRSNPVEKPQPGEEQALFDREELQQFAAEDVAAGRRIGMILAALFIYTVIAMSVATWWTFRTVGH